MTDRHPLGVLDTSVVVDLGQLDPVVLPIASAVTTLTLAELSVGPLSTDDPDERIQRQARLQRAEAELAPLDFDTSAARSYVAVYERARRLGRSPRGRRAVDLLIAAVAVSRGLPLYTRNPDDFAGLEGLLDVVAV